MIDELARCKELAAQARDLAETESDEWIKKTLLSIAADHESLAAGMQAELNAKAAQPD